MSVLSVPGIMAEIVAALASGSGVALHLPAAKLLAVFSSQALATALDVSLVASLGQRVANSMAVHVYTRSLSLL